MELKTIVLEGITYVLIPKDVFDKSLGIESEEPLEDNLSDFENENLPDALKEEVVIVASVTGVKKAQGGTYAYRERLKKHALLPEDVMVLKTDFEVMSESPEISRNDFKNRIPPGKWGFYGPGAERDLG